MIGIHDISSVAREILRAVGVCTDKAIALQNGNGTPGYSVPVRLRVPGIMLFYVESLPQIKQDKGK